MSDSPSATCLPRRGRPHDAAAQLNLHTRDLDEFRQSLGYLGAEVAHLGRGSFGASVRLLQLGPLQILDLSTLRPLHARGWRPDAFGFNLITPENPGIRIQRRVLHAGQVSTIAPPGHWDHITATGMQGYLCLTVNANYLRQAAEVLYRRDLEPQLKNGVYSPNPQTFATLVGWVRRLLTVDVSQLATDNVAWQRCVEVLLHSLFPAEVAPEPRGSVSRRRVLNQAVEFMLAHLDRRLSLLDICREVDASERTVRTAFVDVFGIGPMAYLKARKLSAIHQLLRHADPATTSVQEIARRWGFEHTGNFAADYHRFIGELPSETLGGSV